MSATDCLTRKISSCEAKVNQAGKMLNACIRLDSVVGVLNVESYKYGTLPSQIPIWKVEYISTAKNSFVVVRCGN